MAELLNNRYILHEPLGAGGMGAVFRATDRLTSQTVALKQLLFDSDSPEEEDNLRLALTGEFRTLASLRHPHVVSVMDYGFDAQRKPYFTMDFLSGAQTIDDAGKDKSPAEQIRLLVELLQALAYVHRRGILHRDLKPGNVLATNGAVKLLDFGLSIERQQSGDQPEEISGTPAYIAPELWKGQQPSAASDLYAVGVIACEVLAGHLPFDADDGATLIRKVLASPPDLSGIENPEVAEVVERLLAKEAYQRYEQADEVIADLCRAANQPIPEESAVIRESFLQASQFVGREAELEQLKEALDRILDGNKPEGSVWLVGGESGIGKSRLLDELRIRALVAQPKVGTGAMVLRGQAASDQALTDQVWREPLRHLALSATLSDLEAGVLKEIVPDIRAVLGRNVPHAPPLDGKAGRERLLSVLTDVFRRQSQPTLLILEDLQWAGEGLEPLKRLNSLASHLPLVVVGSFRDDERPNLPDDLPGAKLIKLARLDEEKIAELSAAMLGANGRDPSVLHLLERETEGNVFFIVEVVRALAEEAGSLSGVGQATLPKFVFAGGVRRVIQRRLNHVPESARPLLRLAAIAGRQLDLKVLAALNSGQDERLDDWLTACANAAVLEFQDEAWRFSHDKLREELLNGLTDIERPALHRQVAEAIEAVYPDDESRAPVLVGLWHEAGDAAKEAHYAWQTGEQFRQVSRFREGLAVVERALERASDDHMRVKLLNIAAELCYNLSEYPRSGAYSEQALSVAQKVGDKNGEALALYNDAHVHYYQSDFQVGQSLYERALALWREVDDRKGITHALMGLGTLCVTIGDYERGEACYEECLTLCREVGDQVGISGVLNNRGGIAREKGRFDESLAYYEEALAIRRQVGDLYGIAGSVNNLAITFANKGDYSLARKYWEESLAIRREIGDKRGVATILYNLGEAARLEKDDFQALLYLQESLGINRELGLKDDVAMTLTTLGELYRAQGDFPGARASLEEGVATARETGDPIILAYALTGLSRILLTMDEDAAARERLNEAIREAQAIGILPRLLESLVVMAEWQIKAGQMERGVELLALVAGHEAAEDESHQTAQKRLSELEAALPPAQFNSACEHGKALDLETVVKEMLAFTLPPSEPPL